MLLTTMPDLGNLITINPLTITSCSNNSRPDPNPNKELENPQEQESNGPMCAAIKKLTGSKSLDDYLRQWIAKNEDLGAPKSKSFLPFLVAAPKLAECLVCENVIYPGEEIPCVVRDCKGSYHLSCARNWLGFSQSSKAFKCPQHACFLCKKSYHLWRCSKCHLASHDKCAAYPEYVLHFKDNPSQKICWRHAIDWPPLKPAAPTNSVEEFFCRLPLPYIAKEFNIDLTSKDPVEKELVENNRLEPPEYVHIRRNIYLVKKKRDGTDRSTGCTDCSSSTCSDDCVCRSQCISCSKACRCSETCTNKPFRKDKKIKIVSTKHCGWGVEAAESIKKGEFIIEYVGEVISDALCEQRLWDMKYKGLKNFYMCEIRKDFTIDATFKGNASRFLNHSCGPNCNLEKWDVDGETRVGVFAARAIEAGEPLTYDYRFVQFGPEVKCQCGASCCQGYLGSKKKTPKLGLCLLDWGAKRRRTATASLRIIRQ
ncbi:putative [histone H3]-lysine(4) N-trimethyltransferase transcription regulator SET family [Helianthus annuus]|nr:putative [histone H3]-lysine(4) N-trimethyltransferase transcription regulator SET family [Helianthus annuus]KAJ0934240.1 putative [histone H3]-lysine(4) N-trimethyltransferase transcription regulator SET family [Helianthus annuus]KAJ0942314.1 putative histone-lysine N-methyltransferase transcription regulator SET family [Helianthus annuus]